MISHFVCVCISLIFRDLVILKKQNKHESSFFHSISLYCIVYYSTQITSELVNSLVHYYYMYIILYYYNTIQEKNEQRIRKRSIDISINIFPNVLYTRTQNSILCIER